MEEAKKKDAERQEAIKNGRANELPPLHGIPISVKDLVRDREDYGCSLSKRAKE